MIYIFFLVMENILEIWIEPADYYLKTFESISKTFKNLETIIISWDFQLPDWKKEMKLLKSDFVKLFNVLIKHKDIADLYIEWIWYLWKINIDFNSDFWLIRNIYDVLKLYFDSLSKSRQMIVNVAKKKIISNLSPKKIPNVIKIPDVLKEINYWTEIWKLFELFELSEDNCYEVFDNIDLWLFSKEKLNGIFSYLKDLLKSKKLNDEPLKEFIKFLIRTIINYINYDNEIKKIEEEKREMDEKKILLENFFVSWLSYFSDFIAVFEKYQIDYQEIKNISSFDELKKLFCGEYVKSIENNYRSILKESWLEENYILREVSDISKMYSNMTTEKFLIAFKRWFLIGDIYEFLSKKRKEFSSFDKNAGEYLLQKINKYESI